MLTPVLKFVTSISVTNGDENDNDLVVGLIFQRVKRQTYSISLIYYSDYIHVSRHLDKFKASFQTFFVTSDINTKTVIPI